MTPEQSKLILDSLSKAKTLTVDNINVALGKLRDPTGMIPQEVIQTVLGILKQRPEKPLQELAAHIEGIKTPDELSNSAVLTGTGDVIHDENPDAPEPQIAMGGLENTVIIEGEQRESPIMEFCSDLMQTLQRFPFLTIEKKDSAIVFVFLKIEQEDSKTKVKLLCQTIDALEKTLDTFINNALERMQKHFAETPMPEYLNCFSVSMALLAPIRMRLKRNRNRFQTMFSAKHEFLLTFERLWRNKKRTWHNFLRFILRCCSIAFAQRWKRSSKLNRLLEETQHDIMEFVKIASELKAIIPESDDLPT